MDKEGPLLTQGEPRHGGGTCICSDLRKNTSKPQVLFQITVTNNPPCNVTSEYSDHKCDAKVFQKAKALYGKKPTDTPKKTHTNTNNQNVNLMQKAL